MVNEKEDTFVTNVHSYTMVGDTKILRFLKVLTFHLAGVSCIIAYNTILSGLDCFIFYYEDYSPQILLPNIYFFFNFFFQIFFMLKGIKYSHFFLIQTCLIVTTVTLILNPLIMQYTSSLVSFIVTCLLTALQGFANAMLFNLFYTLIMHLDDVYITATIAGHSLSGIIMNLTRLATFFIFGLQKKENINKKNIDLSFSTFYYLAALVIMINFLMMIFLKRQKDFKIALRKACPSDELFDDEINNDERCLSLCSDPPKIPYQDGENIEDENNPNNSKSSEFQKYKFILKTIPGVHLILFAHTVITLAIYPPVLIAKQIYSDNMSESIIIILIIFNLSDMISREMTRFIVLNFRGIYIIVIFRIIFLILFPVICLYLDETAFAKWFQTIWTYSVLLILLGGTNGFIISNCFIYIHNTNKIQNNLKPRVSLALSAFLNFGCFVGTILSYLFLLWS
jgi:hypothetical protein